MSSTNNYTIKGGTGNDGLSVKIHNTANTSAIARNQTVIMSGGTGADTMSLLFDLNAGAVASAGTSSSANTFKMYQNSVSSLTDTSGGAMTFQLAAFAAGDINIDDNIVLIEGGSGAGAISARVTGSVNNSELSGDVSISLNTITVHGHGGGDTLSLGLNALHTSNALGGSYIKGNAVVVTNSGTDTAISDIDIDIDVIARANATVAGTSSSAIIGAFSGSGSTANTFIVSGGAGKDTIMFNMTASAAYNVASLSANSITIDAQGGSDNMTVALNAQGLIATGYGGTAASNAYIVDNVVNMTGGTGGDGLSLLVSVNAATTAGITGNTFNLYQQNSLSSTDMGAGTLSLALAAAAPTVNFSSNTIKLSGAAGSDTLKLDLGNLTGTGNSIILHGGAGQDILSLTNVNTSTTVTFSYANVAEITSGADTIKGIGQYSTFKMKFTGFETFTGNFLSGATTNVSAANGLNWFYDTNDQKLLYSANGFNTATATDVANVVATFTGSNLGLGASGQTGSTIAVSYALP